MAGNARAAVSITHVTIAAEYYKLGISSAVELSIYALASSFGNDGIYASNSELAILFRIQRPNVVRIVRRLELRGFVKVERTKGYRRIIAKSITLILSDSINSDTNNGSNSDGQTVSNRCSKWSQTDTYKLSKLKRKDNTQINAVCAEKIAALDSRKTKENTGMSSFDKFWQAHPKKVGKEAAAKAWRNIDFRQTSAKTIIDAIIKQKKVKGVQWAKDNYQYCLNPATWLNGKRWEDQIGNEKQKAKEKRLCECGCGKPAHTQVGNKWYAAYSHYERNAKT
jgi:DNA-binding MarR family transcriptional regulator